MAGKMAHLWACITGPRLFRIYSAAGSQEPGQQYVPNILEKAGGNAIQAFNLLWNIGILTSPFIVIYLWRNDYMCLKGCLAITRAATGMTLLLIVTMVIRGIGRTYNSDYTTFLKVLNNFNNKKDTPINSQVTLDNYDFDFWAWPENFYWNQGEINGSRSRVYAGSRRRETGLTWFMQLPCQFIAYFCAHAFGRHLMYPGSVHLLQFVLDAVLISGREKLAKENNGTRAKIVTQDGNHIDTMFIDRRHSKSLPENRTSTLVVTCEGNAGFYEIGIMATPLEAGYSVLGYNHPGFGGSSGKPFPSQEQNAIDAVMQYAIHGLNFAPENIIIYAWSIGGYAGTWAAMNYPEIRGLVLDATFDDVLPLAIPRMPSWMSGLVGIAIRDYLNLNNAEQLCRYPGPVTIVRRTGDEIITVVEGDLSTNRGNDLLIKLLKSRYPSLHTQQSNLALRKWLSLESPQQSIFYSRSDIDHDYCLSVLRSYAEEFGETFPMKIGSDWTEQQKIKMLLYLAKKHLLDFEGKHNNNLHSSYFKVPWNPFGDSSYVQVE